VKPIISASASVALALSALGACGDNLSSPDASLYACRVTPTSTTCPEDYYLVSYGEDSGVECAVNTPDGTASALVVCEAPVCSGGLTAVGTTVECQP